MGCDIHDYLEVRQDDRWTYAGDDAFPDNEYDFEHHSPFDGARSYRLFSFLAGVRNYEDLTPIAEPRGIPADVSAEVLERVNYGVEHTRSWLTLSDLLSFDYDRPLSSIRKPDRIDQSDDETDTVREFLGDWYFGRMELMKTFGAPDNVRVVFGFDN